MSGILVVRNRQRRRAINLPRLQRLIRALLRDLVQEPDFELGIYLVGLPEITRLNETFLKHKGPTDVITFDYREKQRAPLHGEIFVCVDEAIAQARRFKTPWQSELARYVVHGLLHLQGFNDKNAASRQHMKREEDRLLRQLYRW